MTNDLSEVKSIEKKEQSILVVVILSMNGRSTYSQFHMKVRAEGEAVTDEMFSNFNTFFQKHIWNRNMELGLDREAC